MGDSEEVGRMAETALTLELSVTPKPGSVDRNHDFPETTFQHFLASAVSIGPALGGVADGNLSLGEGVLEGVKAFRGAQSGGNTHFGSLTLLVPLAAGAGGGDIFEEAAAHVEEASVGDAVLYMRALRSAGVGGLGSRDKLDASDPEAELEVDRGGVTFRGLFERSLHDDLSRELVEGFPRVAEASEFILERMDEKGFNDAGVEAFVSIAADGDSFIERRHGPETHERCRERFREVVDSGFDAERIWELDSELNTKGVNPGASADILGAAIFVALLRGWRP